MSVANARNKWYCNVTPAVCQQRAKNLPVPVGSGAVLVAVFKDGVGARELIITVMDEFANC
jgi:hypothetical protein